MYAWGLVVSILVLLPTAAADPIVVEPTGDAHAEFLAVSGTGNAHSSCRSFGTIPCAAVSGTGNATGAANRVEAAQGRVCASDTFGRPQCVVENGADAAGILVLRREGDAQGIVGLAPRGSATGVVAAGQNADGALAVGASNAEGLIAIGGERATGYIAVSLTGEAESEGCLTTPADPCQRGVALQG